jgi:hypothetical protein
MLKSGGRVVELMCIRPLWALHKAGYTARTGKKDPAITAVGKGKEINERQIRQQE